MFKDATRWTVLAAAATLLAACAGQARPEAGRGPAWDLGLNLACNARYQVVCDARGCAPAESGPLPLVPVAFSYRSAQGTAELCMATGCWPARLKPLSAEAPTPGEGVAGLVFTIVEGPGIMTPPDGPPELEGLITLAPDGKGFQLIKPQGPGVTIWGGDCAPAAADADG